MQGRLQPLTVSQCKGEKSTNVRIVQLSTKLFFFGKIDENGPKRSISASTFLKDLFFFRDEEMKEAGRKEEEYNSSSPLKVEKKKKRKKKKKKRERYLKAMPRQ